MLTCTALGHRKRKLLGFYHANRLNGLSKIETTASSSVSFGFASNKAND